MFVYEKSKQKNATKGIIQRIEKEEKAAEPNLTGIPDGMKSQFESTSGLSFDDVRVHYNSEKPKQFQALAYTQGNDVYIGQGEQKHLAHELGHVVQQKQGRVRATTSIGGAAVNDDYDLERDADNISGVKHNALQTCNVVQRKVGMEFQCMGRKDVIKEEKEGGYAPCGHGVVLKNCGDFKIEGDMGNYEFVTKAFDEEHEAGIEGLKQACENAKNAYENITTYLVKEPAKKVLYEEEDHYYHKDTGYYISRSYGKTHPHPQATVGIKLKKMGHFIKSYVKAFSKKGIDIDGKLEKTEKIKLRFGGSIKKRGLGQKNILNEVVEEIKGYKGLSESGLGLAMLLRSMHKSTVDYNEEVEGGLVNAKSALPLMPRTALLDVYKKLGDNDKTTFKNGDASLLKYIAGEGKAAKDIVLAQNTESEVTYKDWAKSLKALDGVGGGIVHDPLSKIDSGLCQISNTDIKSLTDFGVERSTQIYDDEKETEGIIMELRGLQRNVQPDKWAEVAVNVARLVKYSNSDVKVKKTESKRWKR